MSLTLDEITAIAESVLRESDAPASLGGVSAAEGGSNRVELLILLDDGHPDSRQVLLNVNRVDRQQFENDFRGQLRSALEEHTDH